MDYIQSKQAKAKSLFESGFNCCQSVFGAFAEDFGLDMDTAMRLSASFGGGFGRLREVCGAVSGMALTLGMVSGSADPTDRVAKAENYSQMQDVAADFRKMNGSILCRELLALSADAPAATDTDAAHPSERTPQFYKKRPCSELVAEAAGIVATKLVALQNPTVHA